jgi:hypothetical protein
LKASHIFAGHILSQLVIFLFQLLQVAIQSLCRRLPLSLISQKPLSLNGHTPFG